MKILRNIKMVGIGIIGLGLMGILYAEDGILDMVEKGQKEEKQEQPAQDDYKTKSGFFLGVEMGAGSVKATQNVGSVVFADLWKAPIDGSQTLFDIGLKFGYQHYFGESENHGIKVGLGIGGGLPSIDLKAFGSGQVCLSPDGTADCIISQNEATYKATPMKVSLELDYLWDFFNRGNHTIGLDVGLGYEMGVWFGKSSGAMRYEGALASYDKNTTLLSHTIYPKIGIHYYYGNHQFNLAYKFGGILGGIKTENKGDVDWTIKDNATGEQATGKAPSVQTIQSSPSYISFGYSYRF